MKQHQILVTTLAVMMALTFCGCSGQKGSRTSRANSSQMTAVEYGRYYAAKNGRVSGLQIPNSPKTAIQDAKRAARQAGEKMEDAAEDVQDKMKHAGETLTKD